MASTNDPFKITITLNIERRLWNTARVLNMTLGPGLDKPNARNMADWMEMLVARYVASQLSTPAQREHVSSELALIVGRANVKARVWMDDVKDNFWEPPQAISDATQASSESVTGG